MFLEKVLLGFNVTGRHTSTKTFFVEPRAEKFRAPAVLLNA